MTSAVADRPTTSHNRSKVQNWLRASARSCGARRCCWTLMAGLIALGVMSITWMVVIAALIAIEKPWPSERVASRTTVTLLVLLAAGVAFFPDQLPGLTVPT